MYDEVACDFLDRTQHLQLFESDALYIRMLVAVNKNKNIYDLIIISRGIYWGCGWGERVLYVEIACAFLDRTQHLKLVKFDALDICMLVSVK